jgi:uncharacterized protein (DUF488 family)
VRVFTLGTDHRHQFDFARILLKYGVEVVFDVRRTPESQEEHFRRDGLGALCAGQGVDYVYLGNELGGPREGDQQGWTRSEEYGRGLGIIRRKAEQRACCVLCAERSPEHCHRLTIAEDLARSGIEVVHLLDETTTWQAPPPRPAPPPRRAPYRPRRGGRGRGRR